MASVTISSKTRTFVAKATFSIPANLYGFNGWVSQEAFKFAGSSWRIRLKGSTERQPFSDPNCISFGRFSDGYLSFEMYPLSGTGIRYQTERRWRIWYINEIPRATLWYKNKYYANFYNEYVSRNTIMIEFELSIHDKEVPESTFSDDFKKVLFDEDNADTILLLEDGNKIPVHTVILKARVPAFAGIIFNTRRATDNGAGKDDDSTRLTVPISKIQYGVLRELLHFGKLLFSYKEWNISFVLLFVRIYSPLLNLIYPLAYTDTCSEGALKDTNMATNLLSQAAIYNVERLKLLCAQSLQEHICVESAAAVLMLASQYNMKDLEIISTSFIIAHWEDVSKTSEFATLKKDCPELVFTLLNTVMSNMKRKKRKRELEIVDIRGEDEHATEDEDEDEEPAQ